MGAKNKPLDGNNSEKKKKKIKQYEQQRYLPQIWGKTSTKELMDRIQMEVEYQTKKQSGNTSFKYTYGDMLEEAMVLLAKKKGIKID